MTTLLEHLAAFASDAAAPPDVAATVRSHVLDTIGVSLAALELETSRAVVDLAREQGGVAQARAIGLTSEVPAATAAFVNGVLAHSLDYDDTHLPSILHPSASVVPAALAAAQLAGRGDPVDAIAVGLEICIRVGMAGFDRGAGNSLYFERGQHATSMCGAIGGAAASARLIGADPIHAMAIACSMASGLLEANREGGTVKRLHCGWAAHAAVTAAQLAARGITGPPTALEGRFGFFQAFLSGRFDATQVTRDGWSVPDVHIKPYPANHFTHAAIDCAIALRERGVRPEDVEAIEIGVATPTVRTIGEPIDRKRAPESGYQAQFSGPYTVVAALCGGSGLGLGLDDFTDALARDPRRRDLMAKATVLADPHCDALYPDALPAVVTVRLKDGSTLAERRDVNRGGPDDPLSDAELRTKFRDNASRVLATEDLEAIWTAGATLDDTSVLLGPTARTKGALNPCSISW